MNQLVRQHSSGRYTENRSFQRKLCHSHSNPALLRPITVMNHFSISGTAGVTQGVQFEHKIWLMVMRKIMGSLRTVNIAQHMECINGAQSYCFILR